MLMEVFWGLCLVTEEDVGKEGREDHVSEHGKADHSMIMV